MTLPEEEKQKIQAILNDLEMIIDNMLPPIDPQARELLFIASTYLQEQLDMDKLYIEEPCPTCSAAEAAESSEQLEGLKFLIEKDEPPEKTKGDKIAEEIQRWFDNDCPDENPNT